MLANRNRLLLGRRQVDSLKEGAWTVYSEASWMLAAFIILGLFVLIVRALSGPDDPSDLE